MQRRHHPSDRLDNIAQSVAKPCDVGEMMHHLVGAFAHEPFQRQDLRPDRDGMAPLLVVDRAEHTAEAASLAIQPFERGD
jgi:hypothetical protein